MTIDARAQRLVDEFEKAASCYEGYHIRRGIAAVLRRLADKEAGYADEESWYAVPANTLTDLADSLEEPTLFDRAMDGDASAARQFLHEAGFTDASGNWLPQFQPQEDSTDD